MNVGIYLDLRHRTGAAPSSARLYDFTLEVCEEADRLGCHSIWLSEHHRFDDGYLPQPLTFAAAVAARTQRARIGTAIVIAPLHHPVEIAEQAAVVDLVSAGRLELGLGAGYRIPEFELYGADVDVRYAATDACAREVRRLWNELTPTPVQARVPIWMGYLGPQGARRAGLLGEGLLAVAPELVAPYRAGLAEGGHDLVSARMGGLVSGWVSEDPERDWTVVAAHVAAQFDSYRRHMVEGTGRPLPRPVDPARLRHRAGAGPFEGITFGTPSEVGAEIRQLSAGAPVETVFLWASIAGMPEAMVRRHVEVICTKLAPLLSDA